MKKIITLCLLAMAGAAHAIPYEGASKGESAVADKAAAPKPIKIQGTIDDLSVTRLYILPGEEGNFGYYGKAEPIEVKKGKFTYTTQLHEIVPAWIQRDSTNYASRMVVFLVPGEKMKLTIQGNEYFYGGSKIYQQMDVADRAISGIEKDFQTYYEAIIKRIDEAPEDQQMQLQESLRDEVMQRYTDKNAAVEKFRKDNMDKEGAVLYMSNRGDAETLYNDYVAQNPANADSRVAKLLQNRIKYIADMREAQAREEREEEAKLEAMKGTPAKDFTLNDINGKPLSLSSLRGKYVVLDFWGSWCGWCIKGIPDMKKYYEKYSDKMEILGIDCNDTEDAWKKAVEKHELPWLHVYNPRNSSLLTDYSIQGFPTKIVIDPEGNIAKIVVGEDPAFYDYLDELLGK